MAFAQSSELPPPTATMESMRESTPAQDAAYLRPASTMRESGFASKSWKKKG